jgi:hypothetical protein
LGLPDGTIRSAPSLRSQPLLQCIIDQEFKVRFGHGGVFLSKLSLKSGPGGRDVLFASLLMQCLTFVG